MSKIISRYVKEGNTLKPDELDFAFSNEDITGYTGRTSTVTIPEIIHYSYEFDDRLELSNDYSTMLDRLFRSGTWGTNTRNQRVRAITIENKDGSKLFKYASSSSRTIFEEDWAEEISSGTSLYLSSIEVIKGTSTSLSNSAVFPWFNPSTSGFIFTSSLYPFDTNGRTVDSYSTTTTSPLYTTIRDAAQSGVPMSFESQKRIQPAFRKGIYEQQIDSIVGDAFKDRTDLNRVIIPPTLLNIGNAAFSGCSNLNSITIQSSSLSIGSNAFKDCSNLNRVTILSSSLSIGGSAFTGCSNLNRVDIDSLENWCNINISLGLLINYTANPLYYAHNLYLKDKKIENLVIPESVSVINNYAFAGGDFLDVIIPENVTTLQYYSFFHSSLQFLTIAGEGTIDIDFAFSGCSNLKDVFIEKDIISSLSFTDCTNVERYWFGGCTSVPTLSSVNSLGHKAGCRIYVPSALYDEWRNADVWKDLTDVYWEAL